MCDNYRVRLKSLNMFGLSNGIQCSTEEWDDRVSSVTPLQLSDLGWMGPCSQIYGLNGILTNAISFPTPLAFGYSSKHTGLGHAGMV